MVIQINNLEVNDPPVPASTVMVLRDGVKGLEVLMIQRHHNSDVLGRRETLEESGLLIGHSVTSEQLKKARANLSEGLGFAATLQGLGLPLLTQGLAPWSRWITPRMPSVMNKRFDTRFFIAKAPSAQLAMHDNFEATESVWLQPRQGLIDYWEGRIGLAPPQIMSLSQLARFESVAAVFAFAEKHPPVTTQPEPFDDQGVRVICYPGDPRHSNPVAGFPGPTRLRFVNKRFEPEGGLSDLLPTN